jgi:hypothetical protein
VSSQEKLSKLPGELVKKGDELLVELLASAVESKVGFRASEDEVAQFLLSLSLAAVNSPRIQTIPSSVSALTNTQKESHPQISGIDSPRSGVLVLKGRSYKYANAKDAMVTVLRELAAVNPDFLDHCSRHPGAQGRKRRYIARTLEELYPDREDLRDFNESLPGGWYVATNLNNVLKKSIIRMAADVSRLELGKDIIVEF